MKIGLSTSVIQHGKTGLAEYVFSLVRAFEPYAKDHQFTLFALEEDASLFDFASDYVRLVSVPEQFRAPLNDIFWHQTILPQLTRSLGLDVLHVPSYRRMVAARPCALVATIHDLAAFRVRRKYDPARMFYGRVIARQLARSQHEIIAVSENTAQDVTRFFHVPADRLTVVHNGVDHTRFFPGPRDEAKALAARLHDLRSPFFLYLARLEHPGKNHVRLIEAFNRFKTETNSDWQLALGGADWRGADVIHAVIGDSPFARDIRRLGFVSENALPVLYRAADALVYPSLFEGFGLPPLEAMASGCPVLCSTRGALGEVVGKAAMTVDPEDVVALQRQLAQMAADQNLREHLRAAGLKRARQFDWGRTAAATTEVYAKAVRRRKPLPHLSYIPIADS